MRKLLIMRGPSGSGKSTLIEKLGLRQHSLSMDSIRLMVASPEMSHTGTMMVSQTQNDRIAELFKKFIEERMRRGETLVLDAMFTGARDFTFCQEKAYEYGYDVRVMDMSSIPNAIVRARNSARPETQRLSDAAMDRIEEKFKLPFSVELPVIN